VYHRFRQAALRGGDKIAVSNEDASMTWTELAEAVERMRPLFRRRDGRPVLVLLALPGGPHYTAVQFAAFAERGIAVPIPHGSKTHEVASYLELVRPDIVAVQGVGVAGPILEALDEPTALLVVDGVGGSAEPHAVVRWDDPPGAAAPDLRPTTDFHPDTILIQFTSGSSGRPKGILLTNRNLLANQEACAEFLVRFVGEAVFSPVPQFHAFGGAVALERLASGCSVHLANRFLPGEHFERMKRYSCTGIAASPNYYKLLSSLGMLKPDALPCLKAVTIGAGASDPALIADMRKALRDVWIHIRYGMSESVGPLTRLDLGPEEMLTEIGLVGPPLAGVDILPGMTKPGDGEPQEIRARAPATAVGKVTGRNRWEPLMQPVDGGGVFLSTGDLGYLDEHGRIHLRGRISSFIKSHGYRINPFEIEGLLHRIPQVQTAVVVGVTDRTAGQIVMACLEPAPGTAIPGERELKRFCAKHLSSYKLPQRFVVLDPMPRTPGGKPDRQRLVQELEF